MRQCDVTKEMMDEGWVLDDRTYLKYQKDVDEYLRGWALEDGLHNFDIGWLRDHYFNNEMYFWTTWYEDEE